MVGRFDESLLEYKEAMELEPLSLIISSNMGLHYFFARQYEQAVKQLITTTETDPNFAYPYYVLGMVYYKKATLEDAVTACQKAVALEADNPRYVAWLGSAYAAAGLKREASKILPDLQALSKWKYVAPTLRAHILVRMGNKKEETLAALEMGLEDHSYTMCALKVSPLWEPLRSDPRFQALLRKMNFP